MENLTGGTPPVRYLPCVVPCKLYFITFETTEVIVDPLTRKVAWKYTGDKEKTSKRYKYAEMQSSYYQDMKEKDKLAVIQEEVRILYVAMTRAINNFICVIPQEAYDNSWAGMIKEVGVDYE